jgi:hypothetical protein
MCVTTTTTTLLLSLNLLLQKSETREIFTLVTSPETKSLHDHTWKAANQTQ